MAAAPLQNPGPLAQKRWGLGIADFPNLPPAPRKRSGKCKRKRRGNPSLGQQPGRDTRDRNWGGKRAGRVPSKTDLASAPARTGTASKHLILKGAVPL